MLFRLKSALFALLLNKLSNKFAQFKNPSYICVSKVSKAFCSTASIIISQKNFSTMEISFFEYVTTKGELVVEATHRQYYSVPKGAKFTIEKIFTQFEFPVDWAQIENDLYYSEKNSVLYSYENMPLLRPRKYIRAEGLNWKQFNAILCAFNAPFLSFFAAGNWFTRPKKCFKQATKIVSLMNSRMGTDPAYDDEAVSSSTEFNKTPNAFNFVWWSRSGKRYTFGQKSITDPTTYFVDYDEESSLCGIIQFIAAGTPIPAEDFNTFPACENPYLKWLKPTL
jgi:hypothetical protein